MLCCVHLTVISLSILKVLRVPLSFRCLIFKVLRTFRKVFCRFLPSLSQQCVCYYITRFPVCQHFFQTFLKSFFKAHQVFSVLSPLSSSARYIIPPIYEKSTFFYSFFKKFFFLIIILLYSTPCSVLTQYIVLSDKIYFMITYTIEKIYSVL